MKWLALAVIALGLVGCAPQISSENSDVTEHSTGESRLTDFGPAPEINNDVWLNVGQPLRLADLRGKVVLLEMWTFG